VDTPKTYPVGDDRSVTPARGGSIVFPTLGIRTQLQPNEPVVIDLGTVAAGEIPFHCGMNMIHGTIVVEAKE
jgi:Cu+-exporting ATPase